MIEMREDSFGRNDKEMTWNWRCMLAEGEWRVVEAGRKMVGRWWRRKRKRTPATVANDADENE